MDPEIKKLNDQIEGLVAKVTEAQNAKNVSATETEKKLDALTAQLTQVAADKQKAEARAEEFEAKMGQLEAALKRHNPTKEDENKEIVEEHRKKFAEYLRTGDFPEGVKKTLEGGIELRALTTEIDPQGGYLVRPEFADFMVTRVFETSPMRQIANVVQIGTKSLTVLVDDDEAAAQNSGEDSAASNTDTPDIGEREIFAYKYDAEPQATVEMLSDAFNNVEQWLQGKAADKIGRLQNTDFFTGNGVNKARGFLTYSNWSAAGVYERDKIEQIALGHASTLTGDGLIDLQNSLKELYQPGAVWLMKRATYGAALKLKAATSGDYLFSPTFLRDGQGRLELLGKPVIFCDDMPAVGANALAVAYGDFKRGYTIVDRVGLSVIRDIYTNKGRVKFYVSKRTGGDVTNFDSIKIGKVATSV